MSWDFFISHAHEDKDLIARPLAHALTRCGFNVWFDESTLKVGDSLLQSINRGLAESQFGILILSPAFLAKAWTQSELAGLWARELGGHKVLLPVWHHVDHLQLAARAPMLADRVAVSTQKGLHVVAEELVRASFPERLAQLPLNLVRSRLQGRPDLQTLEDPRAKRATLRSLLDSGASSEDMKLFVSAHQELLPRQGRHIIPAHKADASDLCDFLTVRESGLSAPMGVTLLVLGPPNVEGDRLLTEARGLLSSLRERLGSKHELNLPRDDYDEALYMGQYEALRRIGARISELIGGKPRPGADPFVNGLSEDDWHNRDIGRSIFLNYPFSWRAEVMLVIGRRGWEVLKHRDMLMQEAGLRGEVCSYDRLGDAHY